MHNELFASLPNEVLNLIWTYIDPLLKYSLNKINFNQYYNYRYNNIHYNANVSPNIYFNNYNYYYYILKHDLLIFSESVLNLYVQMLVNGELVIKKHNKIYYKSLNFYSLIDFFHYYSNNKKSKELIMEIIKKYNLTHLIKKIHKNNVTKNIRWNI